jgi:glyoxylase-like metal-dependent hydrolase (beta-lactamase superfamily II)
MTPTIEYKRLTVGQIQTNCYLIFFSGSQKCIILDPGDEASRIMEQVKENNLTPVALLLTHCHIDHCGGVNELAEYYKVPLILHQEEVKMVESYNSTGMAAILNLTYPSKFDTLITEDSTLDLLEDRLEIIHTPGHSPGSICVKYRGTIFSGDTVFAGSIGRTDLPGGDFTVIQQSLQRIKSLPPETVILPGHGEPTRLDMELDYNPFF